MRQTRPRSKLGIRRAPFLVKEVYNVYKGAETVKKGNKGLVWVLDKPQKFHRTRCLSISRLPQGSVRERALKKQAPVNQSLDPGPWTLDPKP